MELQGSGHPVPQPPGLGLSHTHLMRAGSERGHARPCPPTSMLTTSMVSTLRQVSPYAALPTIQGCCSTCASGRRSRGTLVSSCAQHRGISVSLALGLKVCDSRASVLLGNPGGPASQALPPQKLTARFAEAALAE